MAVTTSIEAVEEAVEETGFTLFPRLPLELRRKIWREAITPRTIYLLMDDTHEQRYWKVITSSAISLLSVNSESRSEGLKMYERPFDTDCVSTPIAFRDKALNAVGHVLSTSPMI
ncbi:hypothetical protein IFR05_006789 [Cadophora sp. M221]|nr:hypothetical protein IFR05_006789 [Cadophora sp. M221]